MREFRYECLFETFLHFLDNVEDRHRCSDEGAKSIVLLRLVGSISIFLVFAVLESHFEIHFQFSRTASFHQIQRLLRPFISIRISSSISVRSKVSFFLSEPKILCLWLSSLALKNIFFTSWRISEFEFSFRNQSHKIFIFICLDSIQYFCSEHFPALPNVEDSDACSDEGAKCIGYSDWLCLRLFSILFSV